MTGWEKVEEAMSDLIVRVRERSEGKGGSMDTIRTAKVRIYAAIRALPDRRERIATAALQGLLAADTEVRQTYTRSAAMAVEQADALIEALDAERPASKPELPTIHVVRPGETLSGIALHYFPRRDPYYFACTVLAPLNRIDDSGHIEVGWHLIIPKETP